MRVRTKIKPESDRQQPAASPWRRSVDFCQQPDVSGTSSPRRDVPVADAKEALHVVKQADIAKVTQK